MESRTTKNTNIRMLKVTLAWSSSATMWIRESDIIGLSKSYFDNEWHYFICTSFIVGKGINGIDQRLEIIGKDYQAIADELGLD